MRISFLGSDERLEYLRAHAAPGVELDNLADYESPFRHPPSVESRMDELLLAQWYIDLAIESERRGFDAVITACFGDPGVDAARERVRIPVIAPGETALLTARMLSHHFSVITPLAETLPLAREQVAKLGLQHSVASVRPFGASIEEIRRGDEALVARLKQFVADLVEEDGAELIVNGCASLSLLVESLALELPVPVINSVLLSLKAAEMLVGAGLTHSPITFPMPPKLARQAQS